MKVKELIRKIEQDGWYLVQTAGSHAQYKHTIKPGRVTISGVGHPNKDVPIGTLVSVLKQAGLK